MLPHTRKSSMSVSQPSAWLNVSRIVLWNTSWAKTTPNRTTRNRNLPKGILNVHVRYEHLSVQQHMPKPRFGVKVAKIFGARQSAHDLLLAGRIVLFT